MQGQRLPSDPQQKKKLELQSSLRIIYHDQLILNCTFSRNPLRSGNPAQFTELWDRIFVEVSFRTKQSYIIYPYASYKQMWFSPFQKGFFGILTRLTVLLSKSAAQNRPDFHLRVGSNREQLIRPASLQRDLNHSWSLGECQVQRPNIYIYDTHPPTILTFSAFTNTYHVSTFFPGTDSTVVLDKEKLSIKGIHSSISRGILTSSSQHLTARQKLSGMLPGG